jgi:hypothetical protein
MSHRRGDEPQNKNDACRLVGVKADYPISAFLKIARYWRNSGMRKVIAIEYISLDGVIQAPGGPEEGFAYDGPLLLTTIFKKP